MSLPWQSGHDSDLLRSAVAQGSAAAMCALFTARTQLWPHPSAEVECGGVGTFDDFVALLAPQVAFALVPEAVALALGQGSHNLTETALSLTLALASRSNTTEQPTALQGRWQALEEQVARFMPSGASDTLRELKRWYRSPSRT